MNRKLLLLILITMSMNAVAQNVMTPELLWKLGRVTPLGISKDGNFIYGKTMNDTLAAFTTGRQLQKAAWKLNVGYGYEHTPSMLIEKDGNVFLGTRNGIVYAIDTKEKKTAWAYKIDNSMVNTLNIINKKNIIASTMDGKVTLLQIQ